MDSKTKINKLNYSPLGVGVGGGGVRGGGVAKSIMQDMETISWKQCNTAFRYRLQWDKMALFIKDDYMRNCISFFKMASCRHIRVVTEEKVKQF